MDAAKHDADHPPGTHEPPPRLGKYELIARIGTGGMAEVYLARLRGPMNFEKVVVVKKIHPHLAREQEFIDMLLDEARISALLKHPRVVDIYDLGVASGTYFIAMEYLAGQPMTKIITKGRRAKPLDIYSTLRLIADAADGLHAAHNLTTISGKHLELVHRDVSPGNIIVTYDGDVKIVDFGVARARGRITNTGVDQIKGKIGYVSPEQINNETVDRRSDVFSLGVVLWETLTLRRLFYADSEAAKIKLILDGNPAPPSRHRVEVPRAIDELCLKALALRPEDRYQTAREMQLAIEAQLREANYYRESGELAAFMESTFTREREEQTALLRAVADATETLEVEAIADEASSWNERRSSEPRSAPSRPGGADLAPRRAFTETSAKRAEQASQHALAVMQAYQPTPTPTSTPTSTPAPMPMPLAPPPDAPGLDARVAEGNAELPDDEVQIDEVQIDEVQIDEAQIEDAELVADARPPSAAPRAETDVEPGAHVALAAAPPAAVWEPAPLASAAVPDLRPRGVPRLALVAGGAVILAALAIALWGGEPPPAEHAAALGGAPATEAAVEDGDRDAENAAEAPSTTTPAAGAAAPAAAPTEPTPATEPAGHVEGDPADGTSTAPKEDRDQQEQAEKKNEPSDRAAPEPTPSAQRAPPQGAETDARSREERRADAEASYAEGLRLYVSGDLEAAKRAFRRAIASDARYAPAHRGIGLVYERSKDAARALRAYRRYLRLAPDADDAASIRARVARLGE